MWFKSIGGKIVCASISLTIAALLIAGAFVRQFAAGPGGLLANTTELFVTAGMYFAGFLFVGLAKAVVYWDYQKAQKKRRR